MKVETAIALSSCLEPLRQTAKGCQEWQIASGFPASTFYRYRNRLEQAGAITRTSDGRYSLTKFGQQVVADHRVLLESKPTFVLSNDEASIAVERTLQQQRDELTELRGKVRDLHREHSLVDELTRVVEETYAPISRVTLTLPKPKKSQECVDAVAMLSDQHGDRVVRSAGTWGLEQYDFNVFCARLYEWAKTIKRYTTQHLPNYHFETLWVPHLGDAVNGDIHNMKLKNHFGNSIKAAVAIGDAQAQALLWLAEDFKRVVLVGVPGNHGRTTVKTEWEDPHDNLDYLVVATMAQRLREYADRVQIITPRAWAAHVMIRGKLCHFSHGHQVRGGVWGIPWYGFEKREGRVQALVGRQDRSIDYFFYGHYHTPMTRSVGGAYALHSGAWYMTDEWLQNTMGLGCEPQQQLYMFSERFGRQMEIPLFVRDREREDAMRAGSWRSPFARDNIVEALEPEAPVAGLPVIC